MTPRPSPGEERWLDLAARFPAAFGATPFKLRCGGWRKVGLAMRCGLFFLGLNAASTVAGIFSLLHLPRALLYAGLLLVALAEWLIRSRRLFAAGLEEAFELTGLLLVSYALLVEAGDLSGLRAALIATAVFGCAGLRLLNPLLTTIAAAAAAVAIDLAIDSYAPASGWSGARLASLCCFGLAIAAIAAGARRYQRPAHERMLDWLTVTMPVAGYLWASGYSGWNAAIDYRHLHSLLDLYVPLAPFAFGIAALLMGLRRRTHAPMLAFMLCMACVAYELRGLTGWSVEVRLIIWGGVLLLAAAAADRALRAPRRGVTSRRMSERDGPLDLLQLAGVAAIAPHQAAAPAAEFSGDGGRFGGGGASGRY